MFLLNCNLLTINNDIDIIITLFFLFLIQGFLNELCWVVLSYLLRTQVVPDFCVYLICVG
jgi:hypothetical protein